MIYYIGEKYMKHSHRAAVSVFHRNQLTTIGKKAERLRICTLMWDGKDMEEHNLNVKSYYDRAENHMSVVIRSNERNKFDAMVVIFAIPYSGKLVAPKSMRYYRFRTLFTIPITKEMTEEHSELRKYERILYGIAEVKVSVLDDTTLEEPVSRIFINIMSQKPGRKDGIQNSIMITKNQRADIPKKYFVPSREVYVEEVWPGMNPNREIPWPVYDHPELRRYDKKQRGVPGNHKGKTQSAKFKGNSNGKFQKGPRQDDKRSSNRPHGQEHRSNGGYTNQYASKKPHGDKKYKKH